MVSYFVFLGDFYTREVLVSVCVCVTVSWALFFLFVVVCLHVLSYSGLYILVCASSFLSSHLLCFNEKQRVCDLDGWEDGKDVCKP